MKEFFKFVFATIVGIIATSVVLLLLGILFVFGIAASSDKEITVKPNSIAQFDLSGTVVERSQGSSLDMLNDLIPALASDEIGLDDLLTAINRAAESENIKGIYLQCNSLSAQPASLEAIRHALVKFKDTGKFIIAYADNYTQGLYYLASVADKVMVNPLGSVDWHGMATSTMFYKDLLDKLGVEVQIFKVGTFKSAVEPYMLNSMSDANREQVSAFLTSIWNNISADVAASRNISESKLRDIADQGAVFLSGGELVANNLVDTLIYKNDMTDYLKRYMGMENDDDLNTYSLSEMCQLKRNTPKDPSGQIVAVYYAAGEIDPSSLTGMEDEGIQSEKVAKDLQRLADNDDVKAVVLRVNSPGGSAFGSEQIWYAVSQLKAKKPVIVSMGDYAASGGYYISCNADTIVAQPTTLTGSIGVFGMMPTAQNTLKKVGLNVESVVTNPHADMGSLYRPMSGSERALMQRNVERTYDTFLTRCANGRDMMMEEVDHIGQGRVWTGEMALERGLVDMLGGLDTAIEVAAAKAGVENYTLKTYPDKDDDVMGQIMKAIGASVATPLLPGGERAARIAGELDKLYRLDFGNAVQARMPFNIYIE